MAITLMTERLLPARLEILFYPVNVWFGVRARLVLTPSS
jgi:hypothetical protein